MASVLRAAWLVPCAVLSVGVALAAPPEWTVKVSEDEVFHVAGKVDLPDRAFFYVRAYFSGTVFARAKVTVKDGRFEVELGPFDRELWCGEYQITLRLLPGRQLPELREGFDLKPYRLKKTVRFGSKRLEAQQEKERRAHYGGRLSAARKQLRRLLDYFCSSSRTLPGFSGKEGYPAWRDWLVVWHLLSPDPAVAGKQIERWKEPRYFVSKKTGAFDTQAWRKWIDAFREGVEDEVSKHQRFLAKHVAPKYPRSSQDIEVLFATLTKLSARYSAALYKGQAIPVHRKDRQTAARLPSAPKGASIDHLRQLFRAVRRDVGL